MDYNKNLESVLSGGIGTEVGGDPEVKKGSFATRGPAEDKLDIRDAMSAIVGKGYTDLTSQSARDYFAFISGKLGVSLTRQLFDAAFIFNKRGDMQDKTPLEKVSLFYTTKSSNSDVDNVLKGLSYLGDPVTQAQNSYDVGNRDITGRGDNKNSSSSNKNVDQLKSVYTSNVK